MSARFFQSSLGPQEILSSSYASSSTFTSVSASTPPSATSSASEFGVEMGIIPSMTAFSAPAPVQGSVQCPPLPFVPARARVVEFERLREELRRTEMVREKQLEMLHALTNEVLHELDVPQFNGPPISAAPIPIPHSGHRVVPQPIPIAGIPIHDPSHLQVGRSSQSQGAYSTSAPMPTSTPFPIPRHHNRQQRQQLPYPFPYGVARPDFIPRGRVSQACESCKFRKVKCSGGCPCERCTERALPCTYGRKKVRGPAKKRQEKRDASVYQASTSSPTPARRLDTAPAPVVPRVPLATPLSTQPQPKPSMSLPLPPPPSARSTLLSAIPSLPRALFSPPTPAVPTLITASGQVVRPTATSLQNVVTQLPPSESLQSSYTNLVEPSPDFRSAASSIESGSAGMFLDEEIRMTLEMPRDPFGTPSGFFASLDPQEIPTLDDAYPSNPTSSFDFMDFEVNPDSSFEVSGDEVFEDTREDWSVPVVEVKPPTPPARLVSTRAQSMPTILEEEEQEEGGDGDTTITPSDAQRALLPPDRFARPPMSQLSAAADASRDAEFDSLDTPRPRAQASTFSVPTSNPFDASFSLEGRPDDSQDFQGSPGEFDFLATLIANESTVLGLDASFDIDVPAWNEAVFGEVPSQEPTPSSSLSWEVTSNEGSSMERGMGADMQLQFPSVKVDTIGDGTGIPTEDEFLWAAMEAAQSTPRTFGRDQSFGQDGFGLFWDSGDFDV